LSFRLRETGRLGNSTSLGQLIMARSADAGGGGATPLGLVLGEQLIRATVAACRSGQHATWVPDGLGVIAWATGFTSDRAGCPKVG
jgi:hypothetical protein